MCFSATASFVAAGFTGLAGLAALSSIRTPREAPLAAMPLIFSAQQAAEGLVWLTLPTGGVAPGTAEGTAIGALILAYLLFAQVMWPAIGPVAVWLTEPAGRRRSAMAPFVVIGAGVAAYLLYRVLTGARGAMMMDGHIVYTTGLTHIHALIFLYMAAVGAPMLMARSWAIKGFGLVLMVGAIATWWASAHAFQSVWCFFSAFASGLIALHFMRRPAAAAVPAAA